MNPGGDDNKKKDSVRVKRFLKNMDTWHSHLKEVPDPDILRCALRPAELSGKAKRYREMLNKSAEELKKKLDRSIDWDFLWLLAVQKMSNASLYYLFTEDRRALRWATDALETMEACKRPHFHYSAIFREATIDLRTAAVIKSLSYMVCAFEPILDVSLKRRVTDIALNRCLRPGLAAMRIKKHWWSSTYNNWRSVMTGSFAIGAMAFADVFEDWAETIEYGMDGILTILEHGDRAGGWNEGPGYWEYGIAHCAEPAFFLKAFTTGEVDLFNHPFLQRTCDFRVYMTLGPGQVWNWSDTEKQTKPPLCAAILARNFKNESWQHLARSQGVKTLTQVYFLDLKLPARRSQDLPLSKLFPDLGVAVMRTGFEKKDNFIGVKAGKVSSDIAHCHLDLGSVVVFAGGKELLAETEFWPYAQKGADRRAGGFFESEPGGRRWNYDGNAGVGHNLLVIGDQFPRRDIKARAKILSADFGSKYDCLLIDMTPFYRPLATRVRRYITYLRPGVLILVDELRTQEKVKARVLYHFLKRAKLEGDSFTISNGAAELRGKSLCPSAQHNLVLGVDTRQSLYNTEQEQVQVENKYVYAENLHRDKRLVFVSLLTFGKKPVALPETELVGDPDLQDKFAVKIKVDRRSVEVKYDLKKKTMKVNE